MFDLPLAQIDLQRQKNGEKKFVFFVKPSHGVREHFESQIFDYTLDAFGLDGGFLWSAHGFVEQTEELTQWCLIHDVDIWKFHNQKVEDTSSRSNWNRVKIDWIDLKK